jgi:beta-galactosidase
MRRIFSLLPIIIVLFINCQHGTQTTSDVRIRESIDFDWTFHLGDVPDAEQPGYDDSDWRTLDLPHDWTIEGDYAQDNPTGWEGAFLPTGIGWYRKKLDWDSAWTGRKVTIQFDGVYLNSDVWINGHHLGRRPNGYVSFYYDLTPWLQETGNVISVRVDHSQAPSGRWYTGSGIYRHVWLTVTNPVHIGQWGTYVTTPEVTKDQATVAIATSLVNQTEKLQKITLESVVKDAAGQVRGSLASHYELPAGETTEVEQFCTVPNPQLWSTDSPTMYTVESTVSDDAGTLDFYTTPIGIRTIEYSGEWGFKLNGVRMKMKGVCSHHDAGPVGTAIPEDVLWRRLKMLKEMGANAIRTAHNPYSPEFYRMCDELGLMVMDELLDGWDSPKAKFDYGLHFNEWWEQDAADFIKRDRNHPSIVMWSIGNEVHHPTREVQKQLVDKFHELDPTRPVTQGGLSPSRAVNQGVVDQWNLLDIPGFNGNGEEKGAMEVFEKHQPGKIAIGTEITHSYQTRGVYRTKTQWRRRDFKAMWELHQPFSTIEHKIFPIPDLSEEEFFPEAPPQYQSSYDNAAVRLGIRKSWQRTSSFDFMVGEFRWGSFDYLGEGNDWPTRYGNFGIIDMCGFPKDSYYLYQSMWAEKPMVHLLPHWTHPGKEGKILPMVAYTNCESVELFLNGTSLGAQEYDTDNLQNVWQVPYQPGTIRIEASNKGQVVATKEYTTAGSPAAVHMTPDRTIMQANRTDVVHLETDIVDAASRMVPSGNHTVTWKIEGPGKLIGVENGDPLDLAPHKVNTRKAFYGKCLAMIQTTGEIGEIRITATADGLEPHVVTIAVTK